jgi:hypothetical protein
MYINGFPSEVWLGRPGVQVETGGGWGPHWLVFVPGT